MKYPFEATTTIGEKVTITGRYTGYKHPWCGIFKMKLGDKTYPLAMNWNDDGTHASPELTDFTLVDLPQQT